MMALTRDKLEALGAPLFNRFVPVMSAALESAGLRPKTHVDRVLLVGGSTRIPRVSELVSEYFGRTPTASLVEPDLAVANGAGGLAFEKANPGLHHGVVPIDVSDIMPLHIGVPYRAGDCLASQIASGELAERLRRENAGTGDVHVALMWHDTNDVDLHVITPSGEEIYYSHKKSRCGGELDVDMNAGSRLSREPVENVFWPVDGAPHGTYRVKIHMYKQREGASSYEVMTKVGGREQRFRGRIDGGGWFSSSESEIEITTFDFQGLDFQGLGPGQEECRERMKVMVPRQSKIPFQARPQRFVVPQSQLHVDLLVLEGEDENDPRNNNVLGKLRLQRDADRSSTEEASIEVEMNIDALGSIATIVRDVGSRREKRIQLDRTNAVRDQDVAVEHDEI